ncbi:hypothetical protein Pure04_36190 [Paenarthrobacter ureafaciens]|nr:hypothetical protein Pure03_37550 [Paenarthrobacter ureafaciens]GLU73904.1 hypothetical protein Pure04_36190 [Paenarthrobacter ureafaciens]
MPVAVPSRPARVCAPDVFEEPEFMKKSLTLSTAVTHAGQTTHQDLDSPEEAVQPGSEHNTASSKEATGNSSYDLASQARLELLRGLPSFGFDMIRDEPRTEAAGS